MSNETVSKPIQRVLSILEFLKELTDKQPDKETFELRGEDFSKRSALLADHDAREIAFSTIRNRTHQTINIRSYFLPTGQIVSSPVHSEQNLTGVRFIRAHIDDMQVLRAFLNEIKAEMENNKKVVAFELYTRGNLGYLGLKGADPEKVCTFKMASNRYKVLRYLADSKTYTDSIDIATDLTLETAGEVRDAVEAIRTKVFKELGVEREQVISNNPETSVGYGFLNLEVRV